MICTRAKYTANTGIGLISTANSNLDGSTGTYVTVITGASNGTLIKSITIKAVANTTRGMVRLFIGTALVEEIEIPYVTLTTASPPVYDGRDSSFSISLEVNYFLKPGVVLKASTQNGESFIVTAQGLDVTYP